MRLSDSAGSVRLISVINSLDTPAWTAPLTVGRPTGLALLPPAGPSRTSSSS